MRNEVAHLANQIPFVGRWNATRAEKIADGVIHVIGLVFAISAGSVLLALASFHTAPGEYAAAILYVTSLLAVLSISLIYNMWPLTPAKWVLRRVDHSAIYLLIAGTYTPFLVQVPDKATANFMLACIWVAAGVGMALKVLLPGRFDRLAVAFYIAIGWSGVAMASELRSVLPQTTLTLLAIGGVVYTVGVIFYVWRSLGFQSAVWHAFVVLGAALHCTAVIDSFVVSRL